MFEDVLSIFEPGLQHLVKERERQRLEVVRPGDGAPPFGIDLDSGVAYLDVEPSPAAASTCRGQGAVTTFTTGLIGSRASGAIASSLAQAAMRP
ncbi:MAG: DUF6191 domain-containing protein [Georgenia sp.]